MKNASPTRRSFLVAAAAGAAGTALCSPLLRAGEGSPRTLRIGIAGDVSAAMFPFHEHAGCTVIPGRSIDQLIADRGIDAVVIATAAADHAAHAIAAMRAGKGVLCAPPAATTLDDCHRLLDAATRSRRTYMLAEPGYWHPITAVARKLYEQGAFGRLYLTEADSAAQHIAITGERLVDVSSVGTTALFHTDRGTGLRVAAAAAGRANFHGERMTLFSDANGATMVRAAAGVSSELPVDRATDPSRLIVREFIDACLTGRTPRPGIHDALACTVPAIVARQSAAKNGERLTIPSLDPVA